MEDFTLYNKNEASKSVTTYLRWLKEDKEANITLVPAKGY